MKISLKSIVSKTTLLSKALSKRSIAISVCLVLGSNLTQAANPNPANDAADNSTRDVFYASKGAEQLSAANKLQIVYLGTKKFLNEMEASGAVKGGTLDINASNQIIIVESTDKDMDFLQPLLARGNFIISVGGGSNDVAKATLDSLFRIDSKSKVEQADEHSGSFRARTGGKIVTGKVAAVRYLPSRGFSFDTAEQNEALGIADAIAWATSVIKDELATGPQSHAKSIEYTRNNSVDCKNADGTKTGTLSLKTQYSKESDTNSSYDYWTLKHTTQVVPTNSFRNASITNILAADDAYNYDMLDYDPTTTTSSATASGTVTFNTGAVGGTIGWAYSLPDVGVNDTSYGETMVLSHLFQSYSSAAYSTFKVQPGSFIKVPAGTSSLWNKVYEGANASFQRTNYNSGNCSIKIN